MKTKVLVFFLVFGFSLGAQEGTKESTEKGICSIDAEKFCGGMKVGGEQKRCLLDHVHELSPDCKNNQLSPKEVFSKVKKTGKRVKSIQAN